MAQSLKRAPAERRRAVKKESHRNGGGMPLRLKRQREKYAADPNSVSDVLSRLPALFAGAAVRTVCGHDI